MQVRNSIFSSHIWLYWILKQKYILLMAKFLQYQPYELPSYNLNLIFDHEFQPSTTRALSSCTCELLHSILPSFYCLTAKTFVLLLPLHVSVNGTRRQNHNNSSKRSPHVRESGIHEILASGIRNPAHGNPESRPWNPESSLSWNPESTVLLKNQNTLLKSH